MQTWTITYVPTGWEPCNNSGSLPGASIISNIRLPPSNNSASQHQTLYNVNPCTTSIPVQRQTLYNVNPCTTSSPVQRQTLHNVKPCTTSIPVLVWMISHCFVVYLSETNSFTFMFRNFQKIEASAIEDFYGLASDMQKTSESGYILFYQSREWANGAQER